LIDETNEGGFSVLRAAVARYRAVLGTRLVAAYALGSLAHGGFSPLVSDVDVGLVLSDPVEPSDPPTIRAVAEAVKAGGTVLHERLSVFWGTPETLAGRAPGGRFPPLDRLDLLENGLLLEGTECRQDLTGPDPADLLVEGAKFALDFLGPGHEPQGAAGASLGSLTPAGDEVIEEIRQPELLVKRDTRHLTKIVLFPVRFLFTAATGLVGTNHAAVDYYLANPEADAPALVAAGLHWRTVPPEDQPAAVALLQRELRPLYLEYIDDHTTRLEDVGRVDLAAAFTAWRRRLTT
jgi:predicted nucleotidyltransferase